MNRYRSCSMQLIVSHVAWRYILCTLVIAVTTVYAQTPCFDHKGEPSKPLTALLALSTIACNVDLASVVEATQKQWLRPADKERYELVDDVVLSDAKDGAQDLFAELGFIDAIEPTHMYYEYALLLGGTTKSMIRRTQSIINYCNQGVHFNSVVLLVGQRMLTTDERENPQRIREAGILDEAQHEQFLAEWNSTAQTETDAIALIWKYIALPAEMRDSVTVVLVDAPAKQKPDGTYLRPNTMDTIVAWMNMNPKPGSCLAVTTQPQVLYQESVLKTGLPHDFMVEGVGPRVSVGCTKAEIFDALARFLYQESARLKALK